MEAQISAKTPESFENARKIYNEGGNSKSYAMINLGEPLKTGIKKGDLITGKNAEGTEVAGKAYADYDMGVSTIKVQYMTTDLQDSYVQCQVGALLETNTKGCFAGETGELKIDEQMYAYTYNVLTDNRAGRTM